MNPYITPSALSEQKVDQQVPAYAVEGALPHSPDVRRGRLGTYAVRILKACGLVALVLLCHLVVDNINARRGAPVAGPEAHVGDLSLGRWPDLPPHVKYGHCAKSSEWKRAETSAPYASSIRLRLSSKADLLFFLSRGPAFGTVQIMQTDRVGTTVDVTTTVEYNQGDALDQTMVCTVEKTDVKASDGFAVLARTKPPADLKMNWHVLIELPAALHDVPVKLKDFSTDMPIFEHQVTYLAKTVRFRSFSLSTTDKPISVWSVSAVTANVMNANAAITGSFNASSALTLTSTNAPIKAAVGLVHGGGRGRATALTMSNANAAIDASVYLYSARRDDTRGTFSVAGTSSAAPVTIAFPAAPVGSTLSVDATSKFAAATVSLHRTYEGAFALGTSLSKVALNVDKNVTDPAGEGRTRKVDVTTQTKTKLEGTVAWVASYADARAAGSVKVTTSLAAATLNL